jgi:hypothetical protein
MLTPELRPPEEYQNTKANKRKARKGVPRWTRRILTSHQERYSSPYQRPVGRPANEIVRRHL